MKHLILIFNILIDSICLGQSNHNITLKPPINDNSIANWPSVEMAKISSNGNYCGYVVNIEGQNSHHLTILDLTSNKQLVSNIKGEYQFSSNSKICIWINSNDSLCIANLKKSAITYIPNVMLFSLDNKKLSYLNKDDKNVFIENIEDFKKLHSNTSTTSTILLNNGKNKITLGKNIQGKEILKCENTKNGKKMVIWEGLNLNNLIIDETHNQISFMSDSNKTYIWHYKIGMIKTCKLEIYQDSNYSITALSHFSKGGNNIFVYLGNRIDAIQSNKKKAVIVWNYLDSELKSEQMADLGRSYTGVIRLSDHKLMQLDMKNDWLMLPKISDTVALIRHQEKKTSGEEAHWNSESIYSWNIISLNKLEIKKSLNDINQNSIVELSPHGKYLIYFDNYSKQYFVYETETGKRRNITLGLKENWEKNIFTTNYNRYISGWGNEDSWVFLNGERDIWQIDPSGQLPPLNLTNGYGNKKNIIFSFSLEEYFHRPIQNHEQLILSAFNIVTKENGFYKKRTGKQGDPELLTMGPYIYYIADNVYIQNGSDHPPIKASKKDKYIVRRMSSNEAPNFFITADFKNFRRLSDLHPEKKVNWYTSELHTWTSLNNHTLKGILYKPQNFDSLKKYPVIFHYYERKSDNLNAYLTPKQLENGCAISIPYYASNGYLIFCPDIDFPIGDPMQGTYDALVSAASYISKFTYVDSTRMGIQGCSWGGIQTNYLVTHSNIFAAACSASGISNWISGYNSILKSGGSMQGIYEKGQFRIGATLWEKQSIYIKNSSLLSADKITTPILLMHTVGDGLCDINDIRGFFEALHQLGKKSWMLIYEGNHSVRGSEAADFSIRMRQFFNHYLMKYPIPKWMTKSDIQNNTAKP